MDAQGLFLSEDPCTDHIQILRSMAIHRMSGYTQTLPADALASLANDPKVIELQRELQGLADNDAGYLDLTTAKAKLSTYRRHIKTKALK